MSRFETMALGSPIFSLELDGSVDPIFSADTSDPDEQPLVLIDEIGDGELGRGIIDGLAYAIVETGSGAYAKPTTGGKLEPTDAGGIKLLTSPGGSDTLCAVLLGVGSAGIIDLRLDGNNLQYTLDGSSWTTWHTGGPCPE